MKKIYAADFGAGNTCLYCANVNSVIREAEPLNTPGGEPSGYVVNSNGKKLVGMALYGLSFSTLKEVEKFHINIKSKPTENNRAVLVDYFRNWLINMKEQHPEQFENVDEPYWFIGCPTGDEWKEKNTLELYRSIFEDAGYENVYIVPESNAALAFYQNVQHILDSYTAGTQLLLFDQGAYSLDVTDYADGKVTSYGGYLGASIIERMMVHTVLYRDEEEIRMRKVMMINYPPTVAAARRLYEEEGSSGKFYTYLLLQARMLKEQYFTALNNNTLLQNADLTRQLDFEIQGAPLMLFVNPKIMNELLNNVTVKEVLGSEFSNLAPEVQEEIGDKSWMGTFREFLNKLDNEYPSIGAGDNTIIMLTGGGSLMNCVPDAVKEHYPSARVHCDREAISAIGKGMAYWGPDKISSIEFEKAFMNFVHKEIKDEDGDDVNWLYNALSKKFVECIIELAKKLRDKEKETVFYAISQWKSDSCTSDKIPGLIEGKLKEWTEKTAIPELSKSMKDQVLALKADINKEFGKVLSSFNIDKIDILEKEDEVFLRNTVSSLPSIFDVMIISFIVDHYKKHDIWSKFPNASNRLFSKPRVDWYNANESALEEWITGETNSTIDLCDQAFFKEEYNMKNVFAIISEDEDDTCTVADAFSQEGFIDLFNLMYKNVNKILGKLVLEEYLTED